MASSLTSLAELNPLVSGTNDLYGKDILQNNRPLSGWERAFAGVNTASFFMGEIAGPMTKVAGSVGSDLSSLWGKGASIFNKSPAIESFPYGGPQNMVNSTRLNTELALKQAGVLGNDGYLTASIIKESTPAMKGTISNLEVVKELTQNGGNITHWTKLTTPSIDLTNGQRIQVHFYQNEITGEIN